MVDLRVHLCGMDLKSPVMPAAGPPVKDAALAELASKGGAGAIVTKTISVKPARVPRPNMASIRGGFMNTELWSEMGPEHWLERELPRIKDLGLPVIVGLGYQAEEIRELAEKVEPYAHALELSTHYLGHDPTPVIESIKGAKEGASLPVFVKLSPQVDIPLFAKAAERAGADGLVLINSLGPTLDFYVEDGRPYMGSQSGFGWLSGPAIFPIALRAVYEAATTVSIPIIGVGGITTGIDAVKMMMVGASAVQVCAAPILRGPGVYGALAQEIEDFMEEFGYFSLDAIRGLALERIPSQDQFETRAPQVIDDHCVACNLCVISCVYGAMELDDRKKSVVIHEERCEGCGLCVSRCRYKALKLS